MAGVSWPSPTHNSRSVTDAEYGHLAPWNSDGIFPAATDVVYADSSGMQIHVRPNRYGTIQGHAWWSGSSEYSLTVATNTSGLNRVDTVVLRLDRSTWNADLAIRQGTPGAGAPTLVRNAGDTGMWEFPVADVAVDNGVSSIAGTKVKPRTLYQSGAIRPCNMISDIQAVLNVGDLVYETTTGRWIAWTNAGAVVVYQDTGWVTLALNGPTAGAWTANEVCRVRNRNGRVHLRIAVKRWSSSSLQVSDSDGSVPITVPAGYRPSVTEVGFGYHATSPAVVAAEPDGSLRIKALTASIAAGATLTATMTYLPG